MRTQWLPMILLVFVIGAVSCDGFIGELSFHGRTRVLKLPNSAMELTILQGEEFSAEMEPFEPARGDLIVFEHEGQLIVKRVIGVSGDSVEGRNLQVFLNGKVLSEPYIEHIGPPHSPLGAFALTKIPEGKLFVAGDNRDYSFDSRDPRFGSVSVADIKGRPVEIVKSNDARRLRKTLR